MPFFRLMGIVPLGIGITVLGFLWLAPWGFGGPPLFFRVFASFVALGFILQGAAMVSGALPGMGHSQLHNQGLTKFLERLQKPHVANPDPASTSYACRNCNAPLGRDADVSPLGDTKCTHCGKWFNIHGRER